MDAIYLARLVDCSQRRFKRYHHEYETFLGVRDVPVILYDFYHTYNYPLEAKDQAASAQHFENFVCSFYENYHSLNPNSETELSNSLDIHLHGLFNDYISRLRNSHELDEKIIIEKAREWYQCTVLNINDYFNNIYRSKTPDGVCYRSNLTLHACVLLVLNDIISGFLIEESKVLREDSAEGCLYEIPDTNSTIDSIGARGIFEKTKSVHLYNRELYYRHLLDRVSEFVKSRTIGPEQFSTIYHDLESQFCKYTAKIRRLGIYDKDRTIEAVNIWADTTCIILQRATDIARYEVVIDNMDLEADVSLLLIDFVPEDIIILNNDIMLLCDKCCASVRAFTREYADTVNNGLFDKPWSDSVKKLEIDYNGLYSDLKDYLFSASIKLEHFKDSILSADFSEICKSAKQKKKLSALKYFIHKLAGPLKNEWGRAAAHSVEHDMAPEDALRNIQACDRNCGNDKYTIDDFLVSRIPNFKQKSKDV